VAKRGDINTPMIVGWSAASLARYTVLCSIISDLVATMLEKPCAHNCAIRSASEWRRYP
jgi:hypothetical protein